jgi:signal transduction histidine kinase
MGLIYFGIVVLTGRWVEPTYPLASPYMPILASVVAVLLYRPTRLVLGRWVDRTFFKIRYNYAQALDAFRLVVPGVATQRDMADRTHRFLEQQLGARRLAVLVPGVAVGAWSGGGPWDAGLEGRRSRIAASGTTSLPEIESPEFPEALNAAGFVVAEPIAHEGRLLGWILLGEKRSERRYIQEELDLVAAVSTEVGRALDRLELVQHAAAESRERERLDEIDRQKTEFLSRVAHDLRTPLASVAWSVENLLDGVVGPADEPVLTYLRSIRASTAQLGRLVNNLLEVSRLELRRPPPPPVPIDWRAVVEESVSAVAPLAQRKRVRLELRANGAGGPVAGHRDKLGEVVTNLIENAVRYAPPDTAVEIRLDATADGRQRLTVRDHGPGIDPAEQEAVFERFHQGKPSPYSDQRGFGLGLFVVKSYITHLGGGVAVCNHPGGGAMFTCELPEWSSLGAAL